ncbi:MAG: primosomal protein N', partial [Elusimicrobia bacterium]|nr:primosomal protein N' [Elusimicrobiota bacterium]
MWVEVALPLPMFRLLTYRVPERFWEIARVGQTAIVPIQNRSLKGVIVQLSSDPKSEGMQGKGWKEIQNILNPESVLPSHLLQLTRWVSERYACSWGESLALASLPLYKGKRRLLVPKPTEFVKSESDGTLPYTLSEEQVAAIQTVGQSIQNGEQKTFLLHGVTSSGKTEVYLHAIAETLRKGKQALYLVPEISLCPPFLEILRKRFGNQVGLWHSQVTLKEKEQLLSAIREGRVRILMGARSALFVPLPNPGLFILDEEHDHSYKQQEKPRYHARETALKLGEIVGGVVLLGSATPSVESFYRAERGEFQVLELKSRVASRSFPQLSIVGAGTSAKKATPFSEELIQAITQALFRREQVILALNRRGFSTFLTCVSCGFVWKCRLCQL